MWGPERGGHRHEWENAVIFVKNGEDMPAYVAHQFGGKYKIRHRNKIQWQGMDRPSLESAPSPLAGNTRPPSES